MKRSDLIAAWRIMRGVTAALLLTALTAFPQAPPAVSPASGTSPAANLGDLQKQVQELSSELREMRAEMKDAHAEATELRQELGQTREELQSIKSDLAATLGSVQAKTQANPPAAEAAASPGQKLEDRVSKVEEGQQLLNQKVDDQYQTKVESGSKYRVRLSGIALFNAFSTRGATDNFDLPTLALPRDPSQSIGGFGATLRQSEVGLDVFGPDIAGAATRADLRADFFGGFPNTPNGVATGIFRLRTAGLHLDWQNTSIVAGQYAPFFSPLSPTSLATLAYPALSASGNLWVWTPQIFVEHRISLADGSKMTLQGGILDPLTGELPQNPSYRTAQAGERAGQPAYAARVAWASASQDNPFSLGIGGYYARQNWGFNRLVDSWAGTADWSIPLTHRFALTGEFYRGRAIGGLGAAEGRSVAYTGPLDNYESSVYGLNSTGGWSQLKFMPLEKLEFNGVFGQDFSTPPHLGYDAQGVVYQNALVGRNQSVLFNSIYHLRSNLMLSVEYLRLRTAETQPGLFWANQLSLSAAAFF
ncbi:MAG: hypothetical protein ACRD3T_06755 [Terriglobia bacterium]